MSLKAFHIFFIIVSSLLSMGLGGWAIRAYASTGAGVYLTLAFVGFGALALLVPYGIWFLRKLRGWSYL